MNLNAESVNTPGRWLTDPASTVSKKLDRWCTVPKHECCRHTQNIALQRQGSVNPIQRYMRLQHDSTCKRYQVTARHDVTGDHEIVNHNHFRLDRIQFLVENVGCDQRFLQPVCQHQRPRGHTLDWSRKMISMWTAATIRGQLRVVTLDRLLSLIIHRRSYTLMVVPGQGTLEKMDSLRRMLLKRNPLLTQGLMSFINLESYLPPLWLEMNIFLRMMTHLFGPPVIIQWSMLWLTGMRGGCSCEMANCLRTFSKAVFYGLFAISFLNLMKSGTCCLRIERVEYWRLSVLVVYVLLLGAGKTNTEADTITNILPPVAFHFSKACFDRHPARHR